MALERRQPQAGLPYRAPGAKIVAQPGGWSSANGDSGRRLRWCVLLWPPLLLLAACAPGQDPIDRMDAFFDSLSGQSPPAPNAVSQQQAGRIITGPGYAPAYPPYQLRTRTTSE